MKYPRLVKLVQRELDFDKQQLSRDQKLEAVREELDLNEREIREVEE